MKYEIDAVELTDDEAAALMAEVERLRPTEPDVTAGAVLARMAKKVVQGWAYVLVAGEVEQQRTAVETIIARIPRADRAAALARFEAVAVAEKAHVADR